MTEQPIQHGCFAQGQGGIECGKGLAKDLTPLPNTYKPVVLTDKMDKAWSDLIYELPLPGQLDTANNNDNNDDETIVAE